MTTALTRVRILHVITGLSTGGAEMMLFKLLSATHESSSQAVISLKDEGTIGSRIKELGVPVYSLGLHPMLPNPLSAFSIRSRVQQFRPDVIQGWMYHGNLMASFASLFSRPRPPVVWDIQQSIREIADYGLLTASAIRLGAFISRNPSKIVYVSQAGARQHEALGYHSRGRVIIPNGIDCESFRPDARVRQEVRAQLGITSENVLVGLVARYHPMKDHAGFLTAAGELVRTHPLVRFLLVGSGVTREQPALQTLIRQYELQDYVLLLGERHDTARLTAAFDIGCSASAWGEALSVAIGEAMSCAVPCVVTDVGDSAHLVADTGVSIPPSNPAALAAALARLIDAGFERRRQLGRAARQRVENEFALAAIACRYEELYRRLTLETSGLTAVAASMPATDTGRTSATRPLVQRRPPDIQVTSSDATTHILHVITDLDTGGAQMMLLKLLSATYKRYCQTVVSLKNEGTIGPRIKELGIPVYSLGLHPTMPNPLRALSIGSLIRQFRPSVIQGWMYHSNLMASLAGVLSGNGVPIIWNVRQSLENIAVYRWKTAAVIRLGALRSGSPSAIIYNSRSGEKFHQAFGFHNRRTFVVPNGFDCDVFRPNERTRSRIRKELGVPEGTVLVGLVARYDPIKDHSNFLQAAGIVASRTPNVLFALVGKGMTEEEPELMQEIVREGLQGRVFLLGERQDIESVTCAFDIACSASWSEGFSNTVGEAMACGVPCVVTEVGDSAYLVGNTGLVVPSHKSDAMAEALQMLIDAGPDYRHELGDAARQRIEAEFSLDAIVHQYEHVYTESMAKKWS